MDTKRVKGAPLTLSAVFAAIKTHPDRVVPLAVLMTALRITRTPLNSRLKELIERGLISRHIECNPAKRKLDKAIMLTPAGMRVKGIQEESGRVLTPLQLSFWLWLRKNRMGSINGAIRVISDPDVPVVNARRALYPWVQYLVKEKIIGEQNNGAPAKTLLADKVFCVLRNEWVDAPPWPTAGGK